MECIFDVFESAWMQLDMISDVLMIIVSTFSHLLYLDNLVKINVSIHAAILE